MRCARRLSTLLVCLSLAASPGFAQETTPCRDPGPYQALDFWLGDWRVVDEAGEEVGTSEISERQAGCVIEEHWTSARGGTGQSISFYDPVADGWRQVWVDGRGVVVRYQGEYRDGAMRFRGEHLRPDGTVRQARVVLEPLDDGRVRHLIEHSADGGETWERFFEATYLPVTESGAEAPREPGPAALEERAPVETDRAAEERAERREGAEREERVEREAPAPSVTATSTPAATTAPEEPARMSSPMTLEVPLGPVHRMPPGYGWTTDETAGYVVEEIRVIEVAASVEGRGSRSRLEVEVTLQADRYLTRVDLDGALVSGGEVIDETSLEAVSVGRGVPSQMEGGVVKSLTFDVDRDRLAELFEGEAPVLRLTVSVR